MFDVSVLCYGDHAHLATRCLGSLRSAPVGWITRVRIGLNQVCRATLDTAVQFAWEMRQRYPTTLYIPQNAAGLPSLNVGKGPLMRRMFYDQEQPLGPWVMWFDDDSYLDPTCDQVWWEGLELELTTRPAVLGCPHRIRLRGQQHAAIPQQPWYGGKPVRADHQYQFITGGWWVADAQFLQQWDFPFPEIWHNGDDSILGELVRQQGRENKRSLWAKCHCESCLRRPSSNYRRVHVNAEGNAGRRGIALRGEVWPWQNYVPGRHEDYSHQYFNLDIRRF